MKIFKLILVSFTSLFFFFSQSAFATYGVDDVSNDSSEKTTNVGAEVEVNEFVLLDAMESIELYYFPYSATDSDLANLEDVPGGAGSVYVGGGEIRWHANIDSTISIDDFTLTNIDTGITERNEIADTSVIVYVDQSFYSGATAVAALDFDETSGATHADMSGDMNVAYALSGDISSQAFNTDTGSTDFATKFYFRASLAADGSVQAAGDYRATATVRAAATVSS
ncbi:MAG: hypothetical protein P8I13_06505 [Porticoccaceae bacterium]|nr:hypothetical protein [Porticoccaceae bacterium]